MSNKPTIGVSRCLLGDAVRYDGDAKPHDIVIQQLSQLFDIIPVCPEVEAGLSIPRPPVQLTQSIDHPRVTGRDNPELDVTQQLQTYCEKRPKQLDQLSGFVFKSRSPSCGLNSTPVFIEGECVTEAGRGVFARAMTAMYLQLPVIEETGLEIPDQYQQFVNAVIQYQDSTLKEI